MLGFSYRQRSPRDVDRMPVKPPERWRVRGGSLLEGTTAGETLYPPGNQPGHPSYLSFTTSKGKPCRNPTPCNDGGKSPPYPLGLRPNPRPRREASGGGQITPTYCHQDAFRGPSRSLLAHVLPVRPYVRILQHMACAALLTEPDTHMIDQARRTAPQQKRDRETRTH